jgi:hypothetical protein
MNTYRVIDILPDREAGTFADWLRAHPGVQLICRDRAGGYALGAREGAPGAQQVADRWHMWDDLGDYVKKTVAAHHGCIKDHYAVLAQAAADQAPDPQQTAGQATAAHAGNRARVVRTRQCYEQVQQLKAEGSASPRSSENFAWLPGPPAAITTPKAPMNWWRPRWLGGRACSMTTSLTCTSAGTRGAPTLASCTGRSRRWAFAAATPPSTPTWPPSEGKAAPPAVPGQPKVRHITSWIRRRPDNLDAGEQLKLKQVRAACPHLDALRGHVEEFAKMLTGRHGERLDAWITAVRADDLPHLHTFANGLERDHAGRVTRARILVLSSAGLRQCRAAAQIGPRH